MSLLKRNAFPFLMWLLPLAFFTYQFILRLWPSLMMQQMMQQFAVDATAFGLLASLYYYGYAGMQIPVALALDRFGPRLVVFVCAVICGLATLIFCYTDSWYLALLARFLIGAGSAVGFLGTSKVVSQWFGKDVYARMIGLTFTVGLVGAIYGGKPVSLLVESLGGQKVATLLAMVALGIGLASVLCLRSPVKNKAASAGKESMFKIEDFRQILTSPVIWLLALANLLMVGSLEGFADVWGINYLMAQYSLPKSEAAQLISFIFVGMLFGGPLLAVLGKKFGNYKIIACCGLGMAAAFGQLMLGAHVFNWYGLAGLFLCIGIMCCYQVIIFAAGSDIVNLKLLGVTVAFLNCVNMLGGSFFHTIIGVMMDLCWTGSVDAAGVRLYTAESYKYALLVIPGCSCVGSLIILQVRARLCRIALKAATHVQ